MRFLWLGIVLALAWYGTVVTVASAVAIVLARRAARRGRSSARALLAMRMLPVLLAGASFAAVMPAYVVFEPANAGAPGGALLALALGGLGVLGAASVRAMTAVNATRRLAAEWLRAAPSTLAEQGIDAVIEHPFPVVAVIGIWRPRLVMARSVLQALDPAELAAVVRHERAHVRQRDNLKSLLVRALPDLLRFTDTGRQLDASWQEAVECEADQAAVANGEKVDLASALVMGARLAVGGQPPAAVAAAFHGGAPLELRVKRLLESPLVAGSGPGIAVVILAALAVATPASVLASPTALHAVHLATEWVVHGLR
jgi:hypothetical protein